MAICLSTDLAGNRALSGSVSWIGTLLGLTPTAASVAGDAEIGVNLRTLTGRANFTNLETWAVGAAPGEAGTGAMWGDGDLGYSIAVRGNTFRETGGDAGRLTGVFVGASHEGAAGTLERSDLIAQLLEHRDRQADTFNYSVTVTKNFKPFSILPWWGLGRVFLC